MTKGPAGPFSLAMKKLLLELLLLGPDGKASHQKFWGNVCCLVSSAAFVRHNFFPVPPPSAEIWLIYITSLGFAGPAMSKALSLRYASKKEAAE